MNSRRLTIRALTLTRRAFVGRLLFSLLPHVLRERDEEYGGTALQHNRSTHGNARAAPRSYVDAPSTIGPETARRPLQRPRAAAAAWDCAEIA